jgi:hypothetical protein
MKICRNIFEGTGYVLFCFIYWFFFNLIYFR